MGADVNLTEHLIDMVPRRQVKDVELFNIMRVGIKRQKRKQKFAYCWRNRTMRCTLVENDSPPPIFWNRLKKKDDSILLTGIQESDNDLEMQVEIHFHRGLYRKRSIEKAPHIFTLRLRVEASQGEFHLKFHITLLFPIQFAIIHIGNNIIKIEMTKISSHRIIHDVLVFNCVS